MTDTRVSFEVSEEVLVNKIFTLRGQKVMLDKDLAALFEIKAIRLREQVRRNLNKFPVHFMFQLTQKEVEYVVSQNAIPSVQHLGGALPYVFTEYGILQLANVIRSDRATQMSIKIIEVFVQMRELLSTQTEIWSKLEALERKDLEQDEKLLLIFEYVKKLEEKKTSSKSIPRVGYRRASEQD